MATADDREKRAHNVQRPSRSSIFSGRAAHRHPYSAAEPLIHFQRPSRSDLYSAAEPLSLRYLAAEPLIHFQRPSRSDPYSAAEPLNLRYLAAEPRNHVRRPSRSLLLVWRHVFSLSHAKKRPKISDLFDLLSQLILGHKLLNKSCF